MEVEKARVLIVDDEEVVTSVLSTMLEMWGLEPHVANSPAQALEMLGKMDFDLVLLDIRMPGMSGLELLERIKRRSPKLPVIMLTAVGTADAAAKAMKLGAEEFITKPFDQEEIFNTIKRALEKSRESKGKLFGLEVEMDPRAIELFRLVAKLVDQIDRESYILPKHSARVAEHALRIGEMMRLDHEELLQIVIAARLHDIGKIVIPPETRRKPIAHLSIREQTLYESHPVIGAKLLETLKAFPEVSRIVRHHHERWDGEGFPDKLKEEQIPLGSRIIAVAEVYDAIKSPRSEIQRGVDTASIAVSYLRGAARKAFDPDVVEVFLKSLEEEEIEG